MYLDLSGLSSYRALLDVIALLTMYATVLRPDTIVVKSGALKHFVAHCAAWPLMQLAKLAHNTMGHTTTNTTGVPR